MDKAQITLNDLHNWFIDKIGSLLDIDKENINMSESVTNYGIDSLSAVSLTGELEEWLDISIPATLLYEHYTIEKASSFIFKLLSKNKEMING